MKTLALMRKVYEEKKTKTFDQLVEETGYSRRYLISLSNYYKDNILNSADKFQNDKQKE